MTQVIVAEVVVNDAEVTELPAHAPLYDLVNALTYSARAATPVRRLELEALAGDMLTRHVGAS